MVEIKDRPDCNFAALDALASVGMAHFRLLPGANLLIPTDRGALTAQAADLNADGIRVERHAVIGEI